MNILWALGVLMLQTTSLVVFDFSEAEQVEVWTIVNDGVMGGISEGVWYQEDDYAVFEGNVSLENNGGFSSVRIGFRAADLSDYDGIELQVRGDGQQYAFGLRDMNSRYDYRFSFEAPVSEDDEWYTIYIPFDETTATFFGQEYPSAPTFDASLARGMNIIISDGQEGEFRLEIASIGLYAETEDEEI
ncbi:MAG: CIA30 family protein [Chloroflexota bacterium]